MLLERRGRTAAAVCLALVLVASEASANPIPRGEDTEAIDLTTGYQRGTWQRADGVSLVDNAGSRNYLIPNWEGQATPTRLRAHIEPATNADIALLFRTRVTLGVGGAPDRVFGYGLSVDARRGKVDFLRFDGVGIDNPGIEVRADALKGAVSIDVVLVMSGPVFTAFLYDGVSQEQLAAIAWSDGTYPEGGPGLYSHRRTPPEVRVSMKVGEGAGPAQGQADLAPEWLIRVRDDATLPEALERALRRQSSPTPGERVYIGSEAEVFALRRAGVEVLAHPHIPYRYRDRDFDDRHRREVRVSRRGVRFVDGLKDPALIEAHLKAYAERFEDLTRLRSIGKSHEGRDIWALTVSSQPDDKSLPALLLCAAHHANEASTPEFVLDAVRYLLENRKKREVRRWLKTFRIVAVPMVNPDGSHAFWHLGEHLGRTNRRPDPRAEALGLSDYGVDLNRNYPFGWGNVEDRFNASAPESRFYRGPSAGSEPEVQAMMRLASAERFFGMISFHGAATKLLVPYTVDGAKEAERSIAWPVAEEVIEALPHKFRGRRYEAVRNLYPVGGVDQDWYFNRFGTVALLIEVPATIPTRRRPLDEMLEHTRPAWQTMLRRYARGPSLALKVEDADGAPVGALVSVKELGLNAGETWTSHPTTGQLHLYLPEAGAWTVIVDSGDGKVEQRVRVGTGAPTELVVRLSVEAQ